MALKWLVGQKIMNEVIKVDKNESDKKSTLRVLVVDQLAMRMISACCKMTEISLEGIIIVEDLYKKRQPLPTMDAVYLITPIEKSILALIKDFEESGRNMYRAARVFFTEACPDDLFNLLAKSKVAKFIKTLKEVNISFVAYERQAFSLDTPETFQCYYNPTYIGSRMASMERMAEQIATLCATLKEYPSIRYRGVFERNVELAQIVYNKLKGYKNDDPTMGEGVEKAKSQLIIVDRGLDVVSPVLHELTFQAMAYDLLSIENDVFKYENKEVILNEDDELWVDLRHKHIADVTTLVPLHLKKFTESKRMPSTDKQSMRDLSMMIKKMPQYQKELGVYKTHLQLAEDCMKKYRKKLCKVEQDLATGMDTEGEPLREPMQNIMPVLLDQNVSNYDKMRIIILYIILKNGISDENLNKIVRHAQLLPEEKRAIENLVNLGMNKAGEKKKVNDYPRRDRNTERKYQESRWTPIIKDLMEDCIENKVDIKTFPFMFDRSTGNTGYGLSPSVMSARYGQWPKGKPQQPLEKKVPRLIIFIVGGMSYSEMRSAYEVTESVKHWEVIIGSSHISTPEHFLNSLKSLS